MKKVTLLVLALSFGLFSYAQDSTATDDKSQKEGNRKYRSISIGGDIGYSILFADFHAYESNKIEGINDDRGGFTGGFTLNMAKWYSTAWGIQGRGGWLNYSGSNGTYGFEGNAFRGDVKVMLNLSGIGGYNRHIKRKSAWIVHAGVGYSWANAVVYQNGQWKYNLGNDEFPTFVGQEPSPEKSHNTVYLPFGLEWRYRIGERWDIKVGVDNTWSMDDNMDGSETVVKTDWNGANGGPSDEVVNLAFGNTTNDFLTYFHVGADFWFSFKNHDDPTPIIFADGFTDLEKRVTANEGKLDNLMGDADNDGVSDYFDKEPDTPEGYMVYGGGQAIDQDKDGIPDEIDEDPYSTKGSKVDANGRELDTDGDGVYDGRDLEPNTDKGAMVNFQGVTIPTGGGAEAFLPMIYFDFDKANITSANYQRLSTVARFLQANPDVNLVVVGHTDKVGGEQYNFKLSDRRAKAAMMALINDFGIDAGRVEMQGKGKTQLTSKRDDINRRAEFQIKK